MNGRWIHFGSRGMSDLFGFTRIGQAFFVEIKTGSAKLSKVQQNFRRVVLEFGCLYLECRNLEDFAEFHDKLSTNITQIANRRL